MAYLIHRSDGTPVTIPDNLIDNVFYNTAGGGGFGPGNIPQAGQGLGTQLVGRNTIDYGSAIAQNFLQLQENFSSSTVPSDVYSLQGQLWFNQLSTTSGNLYVRVTTNNSGGIANWQKLTTTNPSEYVPVVNPTGTPHDGDIQVLSGPTRISIYANGAWNQIFPAQYS